MGSAYAPVGKNTVDFLTQLCGAENLVLPGDPKLERYRRDQVEDEHYWQTPEVVVKPENTEQVIAIIRHANQYRIPVTPRGAGSGLSGGAIPIHKGICLSLERMNRILEIDKANLVAVVEPGVITHVFQDALAKEDLFFAGYPMSKEFSFLGGNVAENAGGGWAVKYGVTGRYVLGLEVVSPTGELLHLGGKYTKDVTGLDLLHLMVGSEGTLGVFTKIFIKLLPKPKYDKVMLAFFGSVPDAVRTVPDIIQKGKIIPTAVEFMDRICLYESCKKLSVELPYENAQALLLLEADGFSEELVDEQLRIMEEQCRKNGAYHTVIARDEAEAQRFWKIRSQVPWVIKRMGSLQSMEDISLPIAAFPAIMDAIAGISVRYDTIIPCFGHAGDGNLHPTPVKNPAHSEEHWHTVLPEILEALYRATKELGGTLSGEHGIGHKRKRFLSTVLDAPTVAMIKTIKRALDPNLILNPGKIVDA